MKKSDAVTLIPKDRYKTIVWPLPVEYLLYVGRSTLKKLHNIGVMTIGNLATCDTEVLHAVLGKWGDVLWLFANGRDTSPVRKINESAAVKSIGNGTTCPMNLTDNEDVRLVFTVLAESIAARLRDYDLKATGIQMHVRDNMLYSFSRQKKITKATYLSDDILKAAMELFTSFYIWSRPIRSISLHAIDLVTEKDYVELSLFEDNEKLLAQENLAHTIDCLRRRFGHAAVIKASYLLDSKLTGFNPKEDHTIHPVSFSR